MLQSIRFVLESRASTFGLADLNSIFCAFETSFCLQKRLSKSYTWPAHSLLLHVSEQSFFFSELSYYIYTVAYCRQKSGMEFLARWVESPWLKDISWSYYILKYYIKKNNKNSKNMLNILNKIYMHIYLYSYIIWIKSSIITQDCKKDLIFLYRATFRIMNSYLDLTHVSATLFQSRYIIWWDILLKWCKFYSIDLRVWLVSENISAVCYVCV